MLHTKFVEIGRLVLRSELGFEKNLINRVKCKAKEVSNKMTHRLNRTPRGRQKLSKRIPILDC